MNTEHVCAMVVIENGHPGNNNNLQLSSLINSIVDLVLSLGLQSCMYTRRSGRGDSDNVCIILKFYYFLSLIFVCSLSSSSAYSELVMCVCVVSLNR